MCNSGTNLFRKGAVEEQVFNVFCLPITDSAIIFINYIPGFEFFQGGELIAQGQPTNHRMSRNVMFKPDDLCPLDLWEVRA